MDDLGVPVVAKYTNPSWDFRSILPAITSGRNYPLAVSGLLGGSPLSLSVIGGGAAYVRFGVSATALTTVTSSSSGAAVPSNIDFILARTK